MKLTEDEVQKVLRIIDAMDYREIRLEHGDLKLYVRKAPPGAADLPDAAPVFETKAQPVLSGATANKPPTPPAPKIAPGSTEGLAIKAPLSGVVYYSPKPGAPPYVKIGQVVQPDDTVCLIEVMKLFQSVPAGIAGRIRKVFVEDGSAVSEGDSLFAVDP